jgi:hypothetical protein
LTQIYGVVHFVHIQIRRVLSKLKKKKKRGTAYYRGTKNYRKGRILASQSGHNHDDTDHFFYTFKRRPNILHLRIRERGMTIVDFIEDMRKRRAKCCRQVAYNWIDGKATPRPEFRRHIARSIGMTEEQVFDLNPATQRIEIRPATNAELKQYCQNTMMGYIGREVFGTDHRIRGGISQIVEPDNDD